MDAIQRLLGGVVSKATDAASTAAEQKAAQLYEQYKPLIYAAAFMAVTTFLFFFVPRFKLPWERPAS